MRLAIQENLVGGLDEALAAGFDGLELRDADPERDVGALRGQAWTACPELPDGWLGDFDAGARRRALDRLRRQLDGLAALGGTGVVIPAAWGMFTRRLPPFADPPRTPEEDREVLVEGLAELGSHADELGVALLLEPLNRYEDHMVNTVAQAASLIEEAGPRGLAILADTYHMNIEEDDPCAALAAVAPLLGAVHLSDSNRAQPGAGHVPFERVIATLRSVGFDGVLSVECRLRGEPSAAVRECGAYLRGLVGS